MYGMVAIDGSHDRQLALLFPGQGSQTADMRETGQSASARTCSSSRAREVVRRSLRARRRRHPLGAACDLLCSLAGYEVLKDRYDADLMAGHSLGEITALVAADAIDAADGLRLVAARGRLMQEAAERPATAA